MQYVTTRGDWPHLDKRCPLSGLLLVEGLSVTAAGSDHEGKGFCFVDKLNVTDYVIATKKDKTATNWPTYFRLLEMLE